MYNDKSPEPSFGYYFHPKTHPHSPGHPRLDVNIFETPTTLHFDPEHLFIYAVNLKKMSHKPSIDYLKIRHPWIYDKAFKVVAGPVIISDHVGKEVEAFTYGGNLQIQLKDTYTSCAIESPAPILHLKDKEDITTILAEESEIILAERRAKWEQDEDEFDRRLVNVKPFDLYVACLTHLEKKHQRSQHKDLPHINHFLNFIHSEIQELKDKRLWPFLVPELEKIL